MMIAIPFWQSRVSPVFDSASRLMLAHVESGNVLSRHEAPLVEALLPRRAARLSELGVDVLVCGAISQPLKMMVTNCGIRVVAWVAGDVEDVLAAQVAGTLTEPRFMMPGCCPQRGMSRRRRGFGRGRQF